MRLSCALISFVLLFGCSPDPANKFTDPELIKIANWQDRRLTDSLLIYLNHPNSTYRAEAALAFASVQDSVASRALGNLLLEDGDAAVRKYAAFALGQTGGYEAVNALIPAVQDKSAEVRREVLEGLGKTIRKNDLSLLALYKPHDSLEAAGLAWAIYRVGLRGIIDPTLIKKEANFLNDHQSFYTQLAAAHFFSRTNFPDTTGVGKAIIKATQSGFPEIRMIAVNALRRFVNNESLAVIDNLISNDPDYRVRVNSVRVLRFFPWQQTEELYEKALQDSVVHVTVAAAEVIRGVANEINSTVILEWAREAKNWRTQALLYEATLSTTPSQEIVEEAIKLYNISTDNYQKASLLGSLSKAASSYTFIRDQLFSTSEKVIKSSAAEALRNINLHKDFYQQLKTEFADLYRRAILDGDQGAIISACEALKDPNLGYKELITDYNFLKEARQKLSMPKDYEAIQPLEEALAYFEGKEPLNKLKNQFNHPIDWELVKSILSNQKVLVRTTKGDIEMQLLVDEAPGSAANFVQLIHKKYFDGKFFHRVVPNFVVQTGCNRGDGFGSEDYSIRSEFSGRRYKTGSVGMASAGKDTEGTQWFITHSPTLHLDGAYTIFAEVTSGMHVVYRIEVGDEILNVELIEE